MNQVPPAEQADQGQDRHRGQGGQGRLAADPFGGRSQAGTGRAEIGRPSSQFCRSAARSSAVPYRLPGSFSRHFRQIVSRSRGIAGRTTRGRGGSPSVDELDQLVASVARNAGRSVEQLVERQAQRVDVAARVGTGRRTARGPCSGACRRCRRCGSGRRRSAALARPKSVTQTVPLEVEQQVRRLDVAVQDALAWAYASASATWTPIRATLRQ